jgi:hypothetical protein
MASNNYIYKMSNAGGMSAVTRYVDMLAGNTTWNPWEPAGAYDALATVTLSASASSITFAGIPTGYKHLQIRCLTRESLGTGTGGLYIQFNGDTGSSYAWHRVYGEGNTNALTGASSSTTSGLAGITPTTAGLANVFGATVIDVLDYANVAKNKTLRSLTGFDYNGSGYVGLHSSLWVNTNAITSISIIADSGQSWQQNSTFALYGVK